VKWPQRRLRLTCFASAAASFALFAGPGAPESLPRAALLLTTLAVFILAPVTLLWWLGSRADEAERARESREAAVAWRAALVEASASVTAREPVPSARAVMSDDSSSQGRTASAAR
jgi:hypothetical protein